MAVLVWSWDHLSSKAIIRDVVDGLFVWNDAQKPVQRISLYPFTSGVSASGATAERTIELPAGYGTWLSHDGKVLLAHVTLTKEQPAKLVAFVVGTIVVAAAA